MKEPKTPENPLSPEILKLTDKVAEDPKSRLFVPLAEEYMKCGMLDEAMLVLIDGLKVHPHFFSAKVTLGKVYLEKDQVQDAKAQFEEVVEACPDNLFAQRKLARIYKDEGDLERARVSCHVVLSANQKDQEVKSLVDEIESLSGKTEEVQVGKAEASSESPANLELNQEGNSVEEAAALNHEAVASVSESESPEHLEASVSGHPSGTESPQETIPAGTTSSITEEPVSDLPKETQDEIATESLADIYIKQGYYEKGMNIYRKLLTEDPSNTAIERKLEQAEYLIGIFNKDSVSQHARDRQEPSPDEAEQALPLVEGTAHPKSDESVTTDQTGQMTAAVQEAKPLEKKDKTAEKIKRLETWLENVRREKAK